MDSRKGIKMNGLFETETGIKIVTWFERLTGLALIVVDDRHIRFVPVKDLERQTISPKNPSEC